MKARRWILVLPLLFAVPVAAPAAPTAAAAGGAPAAGAPAVAGLQPVLTFEKQALVLSGITPGGQVAWFSVSREIDDYAATIVPRQDVASVAADGTLSVELGRDVAFKSIWIAVDLSSGSFTAASPPGFPLRQVPFSAAGLLHNSGHPDQIQEGRGFVTAFLARPHPGVASAANDGSGAWTLAAGDGGDRDEDGAVDGKVTISLDRLRPIGKSPAPPSHLDAKDVVAIIDPTFMELVLVRAGLPQ